MRAHTLSVLLILAACEPDSGDPGGGPDPGPSMTTDGGTSPGDGGDSGDGGMMGSPTCTMQEIPSECQTYLTTARAAHKEVLIAWPPQNKGVPAVKYFNQSEGPGWDVTAAFALWKCLEQQAPQCLPGCRLIRDQQKPVAQQVFASRKATFDPRTNTYTEPLELLVRYWSVGQGLACLPGATGMARVVMQPEAVDALITLSVEMQRLGLEVKTVRKSDGSTTMQVTQHGVVLETVTVTASE